MKNPTQVMDQDNQERIPYWVFLGAQEDDFLMGKTPKDLGEIWEDEE